MKPTVTILVCILGAGLASAQSPSIIQNTRDTMNGVSGNATAASNQALGIQPGAAMGRHRGGRARSSGTVVGPQVKSSVSVSSPAANSLGTRSLGTRNVVAKRKAPGVVARRHAEAAAIVMTTNSNLPAEPAVAGDSAPEGAEGETAAVIEEQVAPDSQYRANGRRDPFISPVVSHASGSGCSTGKKCLEIGAINLRGVVHSENGFIAVVSNGLNKAYFLKENDPVFNGYVMKITGDSVVFRQTLQDRLGKTFTRDVVKKITTPAV
jgi:hypothetical protein